MVRVATATVQQMKATRKNGSYAGPERRNGADAVRRGEFTDFVSNVDRRLDTQDAILGRLDTAMFAKDSDNENGAPGVFVVIQKVNTHIDVFCALAKTAKKVIKFAFWFLTGFGGTIAAGRAAGWW